MKPKSLLLTFFLPPINKSKKNTLWPLISTTLLISELKARWENYLCLKNKMKMPKKNKISSLLTHSILKKNSSKMFEPTLFTEGK